MSKPIIESIRDFIITCPFLSDGRVNIDYTGITPTEYSIDGEPIKPIVKQYIGGDTIRQYGFTFGSVESYGPDAIINIENSGFYEDFATWLEWQTRTAILPDLGPGKKARLVEAVSTGYLFEGDTEQARYQIQCRLEYYEERKY